MTDRPIPPFSDEDLAYATRFIRYVVPDGNTVDRSRAVLCIETRLQTERPDLYQLIVDTIIFYRGLLKTRAAGAQAD